MELGGVLYAYKGEWGLPSIDFECLRVMCLVKFPKFPIKIETEANPYKSGKGTLPYLQIGNEKYTGYRQIKEILDKQGYSIERNLSVSSKNLSWAFSEYVFNNLHAYYHYFMYLEEKNAEYVRMIYAKRTPFPFSFHYPQTYQHEAHEVLQVMAGVDTHEKLQEEDADLIVEKAKRCVNALSRKIANTNWFFGDDYSELDVIVYSYLAIFFKSDLPNNPLQNHIKGCKNLVNFINRISNDIFRDEKYISKEKLEAKKCTNTYSDHDFLDSNTKTKILWGIGAVMGMTAFALWRGLHLQYINPQYDGYDSNDDDEYGEEEE